MLWSPASVVIALYRKGGIGVDKETCENHEHQVNAAHRPS